MNRLVCWCFESLVQKRGQDPKRRVTLCPRAFHSLYCTQATHMIVIHTMRMFPGYWGEPERAPQWSWQRPPRGIRVSMSVSFTLRLSHPGSRDPCTPWNTPCILVYWSAHVRDLQTAYTRLNSKEDWSYSCLPIIDKDRYKLLRQWSCSCPATCQHARPVWSSQKRLMSLLYSTAVLWRSYRQMRDTELTTVPACY